MYLVLRVASEKPRHAAAVGLIHADEPVPADVIPRLELDCTLAGGIEPMGEEHAAGGGIDGAAGLFGAGGG